MFDKGTKEYISGLSFAFANYLPNIHFDMLNASATALADNPLVITSETASLIVACELLTLSVFFFPISWHSVKEK